MTEEKKRLIIIDSNSIIHRAFHALPPLSTKSGEVVGAVYGFLLVFLKALRELQPDYIVATFDLPAPTFRHKAFKEYKATRPPTPEGIRQQIPKIKEILKVFNVPVLEKEGYEADDLIGTIANLAGQNRKAEVDELRSSSRRRDGRGNLFLRPSSLFANARVIETIILSGDNDCFQLVDSQTKVYFLRKGVKDTFLYDENSVKEKYQGLTPEKLVDFKALKGDASDNIPGVKGIGEKTAIGLILKFGSIENLYQEINKISEKSAEIPQRIKEILIKYKEQAFLSKRLVQIEKSAPINFDLELCVWKNYDKEKVIEIFEKLEFKSLINRLP